MLQLKEITKSYTTGEFTQVALDGINLGFRRSEFVAILGQSGSGKTTCLNIIGGLDRYDSGDLIINGKSTKQFKQGDWDAYRNNSVGFIFQNYNLISHLSITDNVELGMTLSGVSASEKKRRAREVLERVGLKDHIHKKPNQLSGGQMQRVAIARALANDPDIILADEPTGALDSATSEQIMDLIREIAKDKLVIMVTHNPELAEKYADRIIRFNDGQVVSDTNPVEQAPEPDHYALKKTSMSFFTALKVSGKNIRTKKWRTLLTAFASSIGIIGIALIMSLSNGFDIQIKKFQNKAFLEFPVIMQQMNYTVNEDNMQEDSWMAEREYTDEQKIFLYDPEENTKIHINDFTDDFLDYIENIDADICSSVGYTRLTGMNLLRQNADGTAEPVSITIGFNQDSTGDIFSSGVGLLSYPKQVDENDTSFVEKNYDLLAGSYPESETDLLLAVDSMNRVDDTVLQKLGFDTDGLETMDFSDIVGMELKLITNDDYYVKTNAGTYAVGTDYNAMYNAAQSRTVRIAGIVRVKENVTLGMLSSGIIYSDDLVTSIIDQNKDSEIVKAQEASDTDVLTGTVLTDETKESMLITLGGSYEPMIIYLYPTDFDAKDQVLAYIDKYNEDKPEEEQIVYVDMAETITEMTDGIMDGITLVLVAFASISLVVSLIMIGIITYISVIERTKEIGVLRALGARKKDISRVFNAETFIIGMSSGILGILCAFGLTFPVNSFIYKQTDLADVAQLNPLHAAFLIAISVLLTLIGGLIPARIAAKKDPVEALRSE